MAALRHHSACVGREGRLLPQKDRHADGKILFWYPFWTTQGSTDHPKSSIAWIAPVTTAERTMRNLSDSDDNSLLWDIGMLRLVETVGPRAQ
eukprot:10932359-Karenia_brevis.AAC.1